MNAAARALLFVGIAAQYAVLAVPIPESVFLSHVDSTSAEDARPIGVVILAQGRSGSTMLGETFRQNKDVLYWYEPCRGWGQGLFDSSKRYHRELHGQECSGLARRLATCEFNLNDAARLGVDPSALGSGSPELEPLRAASANPSRESLARAHAEVVAACKRKRAVVVKIIRADAGVGGGGWDLSEVLVVHLVRDPRAVIHSQIKTFNVAHKYRRYFEKDPGANAPEGNKSPGDAVQDQGAEAAGGGGGEGGRPTALPWAGQERAHALGLIICGVYKKQMDSSAKIGSSRYLRVRYEDIALSPESTVEHIYHWSGLGAVPARVSLWLHENTRLPACDETPPSSVTGAAGNTTGGAEKGDAKLFPPASLRGSEATTGAGANALTANADVAARKTSVNESRDGGGENSPECTQRTAQAAEWYRYGTRRHAAAMANLWRSQMSAADSAAVWEACEDSGVMAAMGYTP